MEGLHDLDRILKGLSKPWPFITLPSSLQQDQKLTGSHAAASIKASHSTQCSVAKVVCGFSQHRLFVVLLWVPVLLNDGHIMDILFSETSSIMAVIGALEMDVPFWDLPPVQEQAAVAAAQLSMVPGCIEQSNTWLRLGGPGLGQQLRGPCLGLQFRGLCLFLLPIVSCGGCRRPRDAVQSR